MAGTAKRAAPDFGLLKIELYWQNKERGMREVGDLAETRINALLIRQPRA